VQVWTDLCVAVHASACLAPLDVLVPTGQQVLRAVTMAQESTVGTVGDDNCLASELKVATGISGAMQAVSMSLAASGTAVNAAALANSKHHLGCSRLYMSRPHQCRWL